MAVTHPIIYDGADPLACWFVTMREPTIGSCKVHMMDWGTSNGYGVVLEKWIDLPCAVSALAGMYAAIDIPSAMTHH